MRLEYFSYLLEIYRHRSISTAAHALKMKQSTLSSIVKSVETEPGFPIFLRAPTGVAATAEGERFLNLAWEINVRYEELKSLSRQEEDGTQPIRVLMSPSINAGLALPLSRQFYEFDLRGDLTIEEHPSTDIGPLIARNEANIGVAHLTQPMVEAFRCQSGDTVGAEVLYQDHSCLVVPPDTGWRRGKAPRPPISPGSGSPCSPATGISRIAPSWTAWSALPNGSSPFQT